MHGAQVSFADEHKGASNVAQLSSVIQKSPLAALLEFIRQKSEIIEKIPKSVNL